MTEAPAIHTENTLLFEGGDWDFDTLRRTHDAVEDIAVNELGFDLYPNQVEVISSEQMLDAYAATGLPLMYRHWSFGKRFAREEALYRKGYAGLAYEIVINASPCISYVMEENRMPMQALVMAHAAMGHNQFFRNNQIFRDWTDAEGILDYLAFAKAYVARCEERYGVAAVEAVLDAAHALMDQGVFRHPRPRHRRPGDERERLRLRRLTAEAQDDALWRIIPGARARQHPDMDADAAAPEEGDEESVAAPDLPEENLLYFLEKHSPVLAGWQRELIRIVRVIAQYLHPQKLTKVMNEGAATWTHYTIVHRLHEKGLIDDGALLEILHSHANVVMQPAFDDKRFSGMNPYYLGFHINRDIERLCLDPTDEDRHWFPDIAGCGDAVGVLREAWAAFRDESWIRQFLSPRLMREMRLFALADREAEPAFLEVAEIHDEAGYRRLRNLLADQYDPARMEPDIQVVGADLKGDRVLRLRHTMVDNVRLDPESRDAVLRHIKRLWGYDVSLEGLDPATGETRYLASTRSRRE